MRDRGSNVRTAYEIFFGALTLLVGVLFIVGTASVYYAGAGSGEIYSREIVGERLRSLLIPVCVWLVAAVGGGVIAMLCPPLPARRKADARKSLSALSRRIPAGEGEEYLAARRSYRKYVLIRTLSLAVVAAFGVVAAVMSCVYILDAAHFTAAEAGGGINGDIVRMVRRVAPWIGTAFLLAVAAVVLDKFIAPRALLYAKRMIVLGKGNPPLPPPVWEGWAGFAQRAAENRYFVLAVRIAVLALGAVFLILGILNGGAGDVLGKAVMICRECIGLG